MDSRITEMADVLVRFCVGVRPGDWVVIQSALGGELLVDACVRATLQAGGNPSVAFTSELVRETSFQTASDEQLKFVSPLTKLVYHEADVLINILAPANTRANSGIDPSRMALQSTAMDPLGATLMSRAASGDLRWTLVQFPTHAAAQDANLSLRAYEDFVYEAGLVSGRDTVAAWKAVSERQQRLVDWMSDKEEIHIIGPQIDLTLNVARRRWINDDGHYNFPGGEIFTGPNEGSAEGWVTFSLPAFYAGRQVDGVHLEYRAGTVISASARGDEPFLLQMLDLDPGARRLGEFAFGTNPGITRFSKNTLFDEKIGGTLHMALGRSIPSTGGVNASALHWDMVFDLRDGTEVLVDNQLVSRNGEFQF